MANIPNQLQVHVLHAASSVSYLLPSALFLVLAILLTVLSILVVLRLTRQVTNLVHANAALQRRVNEREISLNDSVEASDCGSVAGAKTSLVAGDRSSQSTTHAPAIVSQSEGERVQALEARLDFLRNSCNVLIAQKNDLVARQNEDLATLKAQLAIAHQTKDELLAEKDACCKTLLEQKNGELASLRVQLATTHQAVAAITTTRDEAVARAGIIAKELETTRADYTSLTSLVADAEGNVATLNSMVQQQKTEIADILLKHISLSAELTKVHDLYHSDLERRRVQENDNARTITQQGVELAVLTQRLSAVTRQRATPTSPRYSFHSIMSRRSSESESDSSFDSNRPYPPRWRRFPIRLPRKNSKA